MKRKPKPKADYPDPTPERLGHAGSFVHRNGRTLTMVDDALGRALLRSVIDPVQHTALERYALHWLAGGLGSQLKSIDYLREIRGSQSEAWLVHRDAFRKARAVLRDDEASVCDQVACFDVRLTDVGLQAGYRSKSHAREWAGALLRSGADNLVRYFDRRSHDR